MSLLYANGDEDTPAPSFSPSLSSEPYDIVSTLRHGRQKLVKIGGPMVRYSKLPFRLLCRSYGTNIAYSPMIVSADFNSSKFARDVEYTTCPQDRPLVVQFAGSNAMDLAIASEAVARSCDAIDINCGCPQRWVIAEGYGCGLLDKPDLIHDMVCAIRNGINKPVTIKIRVDPDISHTIELCRQAEKAGVAWISVHGRTVRQRSGTPADWNAIKQIVDSVGVPVVANGDVFSLEDAMSCQEKTGVSGVMSARGILQNPALYAGYRSTPPQCVRDFIDLSLSCGLPYYLMHKHLTYMLFNVQSNAERRVFSQIKTSSALVDYFHEMGLFEYTSACAMVSSVEELLSC
eukprot:TRINITY_DN3653_c0_g1_i1.p1 TRINITY_DN3653_c0_g1~~TRINITY_DN3653_c0_g1_i1.p1  ORF type:complete len:346 (-),score=32.68 TRINITY_DN3653_c0_g1_i1:21-1058(-)